MQFTTKQRELFRDKSKSADDILRSLSDEQIASGIEKATRQLRLIGWFEVDGDLDHEAMGTGHPNIEMAMSIAGERALMTINANLKRLYYTALTDLRTEQRRRIASP